MSLTSNPVVPPRWLAAWLAAMPVVYVLSPLSLLCLPCLRNLPRSAWWLLGIYAVSQQLPALLTSEPLLTSVLAAARTLLMLGLMGVGAAIGQAGRLMPLVFGLGVVYMSALVYSVVGHTDLLSTRLTHPFMTPISLGLAGAAGVWFAALGSGKLAWRIPLATVAAGVLFLSGSRGPLLAAVVGLIVAAAVRRRQGAAVLLLAGLALTGWVLLGDRLEVGSVARLQQVDSTGRDVIWNDTLELIRSEPWSGVGTYQLGSRLDPDGGCEWFTGAQGEIQRCPSWLQNLGKPWVIAHNITLQQLAETGPLGLIGLFILMGGVVSGAWRGRDPLALAVISGLMVATLNDNTLLVPSPFFSEFFWMTAGASLMHFRSPNWTLGAVTAGLLLALSVPVLALGARPERFAGTLSFLQLPAEARRGDAYNVAFRLNKPVGSYRAVLRTCRSTCWTIHTMPFTVQAGAAPVVILSTTLAEPGTQRLELTLYPGTSGIRSVPLAKRAWHVQVRP